MSVVESHKGVRVLECVGSLEKFPNRTVNVPRFAAHSRWRRARARPPPRRRSPASLGIYVYVYILTMYAHHWEYVYALDDVRALRLDTLWTLYGCAPARLQAAMCVSLKTQYLSRGLSRSCHAVSESFRSRSRASSEAQMSRIRSSARERSRSQRLKRDEGRKTVAKFKTSLPHRSERTPPDSRSALATTAPPPAPRTRDPPSVVWSVLDTRLFPEREREREREFP